MKKLRSKAKHYLSTFVIQLLELISEKSYELKIKNDEALAKEAAFLLTQNLPIILLDVYNDAINDYKRSAQITHYHNDAVRDIEKILKEYVTRKYK